MTPSSLGFYLITFLLCADNGLTQQRRSSKSTAPTSSTSASQVVDFDCPEEFGYYPHPADCTQYYVCVFGGALLESCTGGLMYSHELQTCDWPRNVGCGEAVSTVKAPEPPQSRQPTQLRSSQQQQQVQQQPLQQQQQFPPPRPLQRDEAIPKHHLYTEEELGPAEEVESDRQQRVYRGQPATLGQVARDRDGLSRHSNALQIAPGNGREKLSVISFGTQQQYSRQSIAPPPYIEQTTQRVTTRSYNVTQQQHYTPSPYDPFYNIYEDEADLYKDIDYSQYSGQQNQQFQPQQTFKEKQPAIIQQQVQAPPSRKPSVQFSPSSPPPASYNAVQDVYSQSVNSHDYNDNYSLQDEDIDYKQSDIDLKGNRSRTAKRQDAVKPIVLEGRDSGKQVQNSPTHNRRLKLTASFSFDDNSPVRSSKTSDNRSPHRSSTNSFRVEDPPSSGSLREAHDLVLNYIRQENPALKQNSSQVVEPENPSDTQQKGRQESYLSTEENLNSSPKPFTYQGSRQITSATLTPEEVFKINDDFQQRSPRPFRIVVPSSTTTPVVFSTTDEVTPKSRASIRRGSNKEIKNSFESTTVINDATVKPYKLPPLTRETIEALPISQTQNKLIKVIGMKDLETTQDAQEHKSSIRNIPVYESKTESPADFTFIHEKRPGVNIFQNKNRKYTLSRKDTNEPPNPFPKYSTHEHNNDHQTHTAKSEEESVYKLIPIKPVKPNIEEKPIENDSEATTSTPVSRLRGHIYHVTEDDLDLEDYTPSSTLRSIPQRQQKIEKTSDFEIDEESILKNTKETSNQSISTGRKLSRQYQTEKHVQKPLYSLTINNKNEDLRSDIGGLVLATLEAITVGPENSAKSEKVNHTSQKDLEFFSNMYSNQQKTIENNFESVDNTQNQTYINSNEGNNNQIRNHNRAYKTKNDYKNLNYNSGTSDAYLNTEIYEKEPATFMRTRTQTAPRRIKIESSKDFNDDIASHETKKTNENIQFTNKEIFPVISTAQAYETEKSLDHLLTKDRDSSFSNYQPRRQFRQKNRLVFVPEEDSSIPLTTENSNSGKEFASSSKTKTIETNLENGSNGTQLRSKTEHENEFVSVKAEIWQTTPKSDYDDQLNKHETGEAVNERHQSIRKMQIRKKIRLTTIQPETTTLLNRIESGNPFRSRITSTELIKTPMEAPSKPLLFNSSKSDGQDEISNENNPENYLTPRSRQIVVENKQTQRRENFEYKFDKLTTVKPTSPPVVDPYTLISSLNSNLTNKRNNGYDNATPQISQYTSSRNGNPGTRPVTESISPIAEEINSFFKDKLQTSTNFSTLSSVAEEFTTPYPMTTVEKIRDKFRLGSFPKPVPSSNSYGRKPSVEDNTPPPLPSDRCSQELDNDSDCYEKPLLRVRPTPASPDSQSTPGLTRGSSRNRGSATYTVSPNEAEPPPAINRGTPPSLSGRNRPTLKPSTSIVSKASEFVDIYRYPPSRPEPIYPTPQVDKTAAKCRKDVCLLPDCSCGGKEIPGDLPPEETPQIVLLTFDDSVNDLNKGLYSDLFEKGRTNPNGCPISATFYVSHEWTDYSQVQNLYASGHEIASHSVSHSFGEQFSVKKWTREIAGQREILAAYGGVRQEDIRGMRAPFLAIGGNKMFKMLYDSNFTYDSSMPVYENKPPSWPYTLDYKIFHDCMIPPCPTRSYPGVWEVPMVMWQDLNGGRCSMGDACSNPPAADGVYKMLIKNFERHFTSNRSPFGLFYHAAWFTQPHHKEGFIAFLDTITKMPEVWVVTNWQAIQWVRDPTPISRLNNFAPFQCNYPERPRRCNNPKVCNLWHKSGVRYMRTCQPCPDIYPWTGKTGVRNSRVDNEIITE